MTYSFVDDAQAEFLDQISDYADINPKLATKFSKTVKDKITFLMDHPYGATKIDADGTRRALTEKFPFGIVYQYDEINKHITIIAVADTRRKPGYWQGRR